MRTLNDYIVIVQNEVDDTSTQAQTIISQDIKETYQDILRDVYEKLVGTSSYTETLIAGVQIITPPDFQTIKSVYYKTTGDYTLLSQYTEREFLNRDYNNAQGNPSKWFLKGRIIKFDKPVDAVTIRIDYVPVPLELTIQSSEIPDRYDDVVKYGSTYRYLAYDKDPAAIEYKQLYEEAKNKMIRDLALGSKPLIPKFMGK